MQGKNWTLISFVGSCVVFPIPVELEVEGAASVAAGAKGAAVGVGGTEESVNFFSGAIVKSTVKGFKWRLLCF